MLLHNIVVAEDISPLQTPSETDPHKHTHTHDFVAGGLTLCGATYLSSTCCVVFLCEPASLKPTGSVQQNKLMA